jgi:hypothetical protein
VRGDVTTTSWGSIRSSVVVEVIAVDLGAARITMQLSRLVTRRATRVRRSGARQDVGEVPMPRAAPCIGDDLVCSGREPVQAHVENRLRLPSGSR